MIRVTDHISKYIPVKVLDGEVKINFCLERHSDIDDYGNETPSCVGTWSVATIKPLPTLDQFKSFVVECINKQTEENIISGFTWKDMPIWLSSENQFNYKAAYDLAVQTGGANLPITFKFGTTTEPVYHTFTTVEELNGFYLAAITYINNQLATGWQEKDSFDYDLYNERLKD